MEILDLATGSRATLVEFPSPNEPVVNLKAFDDVGAKAVRRALAGGAAIVVMDELGRFELKAPTFREAVLEALGSSVPVVGVLKAESNPFLDAVRARPDTLVVDLGDPVPQRAHTEGGNRVGARRRFEEAVRVLLGTGATDRF